jgi:carboxylesterase type B
MSLWGQSAGAMSVSYYSYAYPFDPIVTSFIADSGAASSQAPPQGDPYATFSALSSLVGCGDLNAGSELLCMQQVDAETIRAFVSNTSSLSFRPTADGLTRFANVTERADAGLVANIVSAYPKEPVRVYQC